MADTSTSPDVVLSHLDSLPTLPAVTLQVLKATADKHSSAKDIIELLSSDQSLTAKILSVANSAAAGVREPVSTLEKAVPLIGFAAVRSIALAAGVFDCFRKPAREASAGAFDQLEFWKHSLAVACAAQRLARQRSEWGVDPDDAFVAGLLHDLGKVALDAVFPKAYDRIAAEATQNRGDIADSERRILGADHTVAGRRLAERWRLPRDLQEAIWLHHLAPDTMPTSVGKPALIGLVELADTIAREQRIGYSGNYVFYESAERLAERLRISRTDVDLVVHALAGDVAKHAALLGLDGETAEDMYFKALTQANAELGRLNAELMEGNRLLAAGARYFNAITRFEHELSDWSDPAAVVQALAEAAVGALQRPRVAAFGLRQNNSAVDCCWVGQTPEKHGQHTHTVPPELATWLSEARDRLDSFVVPAPSAVRTLLSGAFDQSEHGTPWLLPILHEREIAGGIVYLSEQDERARLASEVDELRSFLASLGLALGRANAQTAARRLSEDLADTNRRLQRMQVELLRSRTLSMIAEMAAGAGHELNGPLTVISGRAQMLAAAHVAPEEQRALHTIMEKAHECSAIVSELMDFARPRPPSPADVDLHELLAEVRSEWLESSAAPAARLALAPAEEARCVRADRGQLKTVLTELLNNASEALPPEGGRIALRQRSAVREGFVEVTVQDNGCGMPPAVLQRAFDPFFSHRSAGRRRGLGLARAYRIVEAHEGRIWLESVPGQGSTAHVLLPCATDDENHAP